MSSVVIAGDTSGSVTLQAPAVAGSTTLILPASSGTAGQVLTSAGSGATQTWTTIASSPMVLLTTASLAGVAALDVTGFVSSTYTRYIMSISNLTAPSRLFGFFMQLYMNGTLYTTSTYNNTLGFLSSSTWGATTTTNPYFRLNGGDIPYQSGQEPENFDIYFYNPASTSLSPDHRSISWISQGDAINFTNFTATQNAGYVTGLTAGSTITGVRFTNGSPSTTYTTGTIKVYGIA